MANISSAFGTVTLTAPNRELLIRTLEANERANKDAYYDIDIPLYEGYENHIEETDGKASITMDFTGAGRWDITTNFGWFWSEIVKDDKTLSEHSLSAIFEYKDEESGAGFIDVGTYETVWNPNIQESECTEQTSDTYDYTAENLIELGFYDEYDIYDGEYLDTHWDEWVTTINPKSELAKFVKEHNDELRALVEEHLTYVVYDEIDIIDALPEDILKQWRMTPRERDMNDYIKLNMKQTKHKIAIWIVPVINDDEKTYMKSVQILTPREVLKLQWSQQEGIPIFMPYDGGQINVSHSITLNDLPEDKDAQTLLADTCQDSVGVFAEMHKQIKKYIQ